MLRTQIQLKEEDYDALREVAAQQRRSIADCIREGVGLFLDRQRRPRERFDDIAGKFAPLPPDDLKPHDRWWADAQARPRPKRAK